MIQVIKTVEYQPNYRGEWRKAIMIKSEHSTFLVDVESEMVIKDMPWDLRDAPGLDFNLSELNNFLGSQVEQSA